MKDVTSVIAGTDGPFVPESGAVQLTDWKTPNATVVLERSACPSNLDVLDSLAQFWVSAVQ